MKDLLIFFFVTTILSTAMNMFYASHPTAYKVPGFGARFTAVIINGAIALWIGHYLFGGAV